MGIGRGLLALLTVLVIGAAAHAEVRCVPVDFIFPEEEGPRGWRLHGTQIHPGPVSPAEFGEMARCPNGQRLSSGYRVVFSYLPRMGNHTIPVRISGCSPSGTMVWYKSEVALPRASGPIHITKAEISYQGVKCG